MGPASLTCIITQGKSPADQMLPSALPQGPRRWAGGTSDNEVAQMALKGELG